MKIKSTLIALILIAGSAFAPWLGLTAPRLTAKLAGSSRLGARAQNSSSLSPNVTVFATGLDNPRGIKFGPNGHLYVAEAGRGGSNSTVGICAQVAFPIGPFSGGNTGRISKINPAGHRKTVVDGLPSAQTAPASGSEILGVTDVEFVGNTLYALIQGGCSKGHTNAPSAIIRVNHNGTTTQVADLSAFYSTNPVANPDADNDPDGVPYVLINLDNDFFVLEANHGEFDKVTLGGTVNRLTDISAFAGQIVPTAMALGPDGNFYVGNLGEVPYLDGAAKIHKITPDGQISVFREGFTAILGIAFDCLGRMYVLETSTGNTPHPPFLVPGTGRVIRLTDAGDEIVASGLTFPTALAFGPDGKLYISHIGYGQGPTGGQGQILKVDVGLRRNCKSSA